MKDKKNKCSATNDLIFEKIKNMSKELPLVIVNRTNSYLWGRNEDKNTLNKPLLYFTKESSSSFDLSFQKEYQEKIVEAACRYQEQRQVYLVRPIPEIGIHVPKKLSRNIMFGFGKDNIKITLDEYQKRSFLVWEAQDKAAEQCDVKILNPLPYLCDDKYCYGSKNGMPLYYDHNHLSEYGNKLLVPMFEEIFKNEKVSK